MDKYPLVYLKWIDATSEASWENLEDINNDDFYVYNLGWIIKKTKKYTTICSEITQDGMFGLKTRVHNSWIKEIQEVKICPKKKKPKSSTKSKELPKSLTELNT